MMSVHEEDFLINNFLSPPPPELLGYYLQSCGFNNARVGYTKIDR